MGCPVKIPLHKSIAIIILFLLPFFNRLNFSFYIFISAAPIFVAAAFVVVKATDFLPSVKIGLLLDNNIFLNNGAVLLISKGLSAHNNLSYIKFGMVWLCHSDINPDGFAIYLTMRYACGAICA